MNNRSWARELLRAITGEWGRRRRSR